MTSRKKYNTVLVGMTAVENSVLHVSYCSTSMEGKPFLHCF